MLGVEPEESGAWGEGALVGLRPRRPPARRATFSRAVGLCPGPSAAVPGDLHHHTGDTALPGFGPCASPGAGAVKVQGRQTQPRGLAEAGGGSGPEAGQDSSPADACRKARPSCQSSDGTGPGRVSPAGGIQSQDRVVATDQPSSSPLPGPSQCREQEAACGGGVQSCPGPKAQLTLELAPPAGVTRLDPPPRPSRGKRGWQQPPPSIPAPQQPHGGGPG